MIQGTPKLDLQDPIANWQNLPKAQLRRFALDLQADGLRFARAALGGCETCLPQHQLVRMQADAVCGNLALEMLPVKNLRKPPPPVCAAVSFGQTRVAFKQLATSVDDFVLPTRTFTSQVILTEPSKTNFSTSGSSVRS